LNYAGKFEAFFSQGQGAAAPAHVVHGEQVHAHAPDDAIVVPDAHLLFNGDFKRSGVDLILSEGEREFVLHDYFKGEKRPALASPDGAHLTGDLVNALAGSVQVGQAGAAVGAGQVIGHVTKLAGNATVIRNGVSIILHMGDNVEKGDVVQSGSDSTIGITFMDGTVFGLSSNARMVLNEMVYDPNGSSNSTLFSLVAGTISFVAGETAKHGDMKIDTPVATMGIRGTAVLVEIDFSVPGQNGTPNAKFQVLVEPDGTTGSYILFDKTTLQPIAVVNQAGQQVNITNGVVSQTQNPLSPELQKLINDVFSQKFTDNSNPNPKTTVTQNDSITPFSGPPIKLADGTTATPLFVNLNSGPSHQDSPTANAPPDVLPRIPGPPQFVIVDATGTPTKNFAITERVGHTGDGADLDGVIGKVNFVDSNQGDIPSVNVSFSGATYHGHASPGANALADIAAAAVKIAVLQDGGNRNFGTATFTYSIPDKAFDFLAEGETLTLTYTVEVDNNYAPDHEAASINFTITITGTNDAPVITTAAQAVAFSGGTKTPGGPLVTDNPTSGTLAFTDVDLTDTHKVAAALKTVTLDGKAFDLADLEPTPFKILNAALSAKLATDSTGLGTGSVTWTLADLPAYVADFIPKGETLTLTYEVTVTDSQGATATKDVTVTITGTEPAAEVWISTGGEGQDGNWNNGINWETGNVPTASDDVIIITDQLHGLTPSFPVTIGSTVQAEAKSVSMNDFGHTPPRLVNDGTLTVSGALKLEADAILENFGTITLGALAEILNQSTLTNSGKLVLGTGGDFKDQSKISNTGTIEVKGGTLNVSVDVANSDGEDGSGLIQVDTGATLALGAATIEGGTITVDGLIVIDRFGQVESNATFNDSPAQTVHIVGDGVFDLQGSSVLMSGTLNNTGRINVSGVGNLLDGETVNSSALIDITGSLTLDHGTTVTNLLSLAAVTVESGGLLTLNGASITGGSLTNKSGGTIDLTGSALVKNVAVGNSGDINVTGIGNTFDGGSVTNSGVGTIDVMGTLILEHGARVSGGTLTNTGTIEIESAAGATLASIGVDNSGGIQVDGGSVLALIDTTITGGTLQIVGTLDPETDGASFLQHGTVSVRGTSTLDGVSATNGGLIDIAGSLTLDHGAAVTNLFSIAAVTVEGGATLTLDDTAKIVGGIVTNKSGGTIDLTGSSALKNGLLDNFGQINVSGSGEVFDGEVVSNSGLIDISGALTLEHASTLTNEIGTAAVTVEGGATLTLDDTASIVGGVLTNKIDGTIDLAGSAVLKNVSLDNLAQINVSGSGDVFDHVIASNSSLIDIMASLTLEHGTSITNLGQTAAVTVEGSATLTLDDTSSIVGGTINNSGLIHVEDAFGATLDGVSVNNAVAHAPVGEIKIDTDAPSTLVVEHGTTITGGTLIIGDEGTLEVSGSGATLSGVEVSNSHTILVDEDATLTLSGKTTIDHGTIDDYGKIDVTGTTTMTGVTASGAVSVEAHATLTLDGTVFTGGTLCISGTLDSEGTSAVHDVEILDHGLLQVNCGTLTVGGTLSGNAEISGTSVLELADSHQGAYADAIITFATGAEGTLELDSAATFSGTVANFDDDDKIDLSYLAYKSGLTTTYSDGFLTVHDGDTEVAHFRLSGDNSGAQFVAVKDDDGSTLIEEVPGAITGLDAHSNAVQDQTLTVSITDGGKGVTDAHYQWLLDGAPIQDATEASYTPTESDEGHKLSVDLTFIDANGTESSSVLGGTVQEKVGGDLAATYSSNTAQQEQPIVVTGVTDGGTDVSHQASYSWQILNDGDWTEVGAGSSYTPGEAQEGHELRVVVSYAEPTGTESVTQDFGTVAEKQGGDLAATYSSETAQQDQQIKVTGVTDGGTDVSHQANYSWQILNGDDWTPVGNGSSYTPGEAQEGHELRVVVSYAEPTGTESVTQDFGTVTEKQGGDLAATYSSETAQQDQQIKVTGVTDGGTDGGTDVSHQANYSWQILNGDDWTPVGTGSSYTPGEVQEGHELRVVVSYAEPTGTESVTQDFGTVAEKDGGDLVATYSSKTAEQDQQIKVTAVTDGGTDVSRQASYSWQILNGDDWTPVGNGSSYTPGEAQEGHELRVVVSYTEPTGTETITQDFGRVAEKDGGDLVATLSSETARKGQAISVTGVTDGGQTVTDGLSYDWKVSTDGKDDWTSVGHDSSFTPGYDLSGKKLELIVTHSDATETESATYHLGTIEGDNSQHSHVEDWRGEHSHAPPVIDTTQILLAQVGNKTTISGVQVTDADPAASTEIYSYSETALHGTLSGPATGSGNLQQINAALGSIIDNSQNNSNADKVTLTINDSFGNSDSVSFVFSVGGNSGEKSAALTGGDGKDVIMASSHDDQMTGGPRADQFVFAPTKSDNTDTITDFTHGQDRLDLRAFSDLVDAASLNDQWIRAHTSVVGQDTLITLNLPGPGHHTDTILLQHVTSALQVGDFIVSPHHAAGSV
jgi:fibronectin-binding autotransporter adhesin